MKTDKFGQMIYNEDDVFNILMHDVNPNNPNHQPGPFIVDGKLTVVEKTNEIAGYNVLIAQVVDDLSIEEFDAKNHKEWFMPDSYKEMDIAKHVLSLCKTEHELQRCGQELLMYMERDLFDLLRYMVYLVDTMELNNVTWGIGRGSSVSSYVLYLLKVHRVDSIFYKLDPSEFLR